MATAWTTPVLCGSAAFVSSGDAAFSGYSNVPVVDGEGIWGDYAFTASDVSGDTIKLLEWDTEIPGAGANVTRMKVTYQGWESVSSGTADLFVRGYGITLTEQTNTISGQIWVTKTIDETIATWGISAAEIDQLVSNSTSYGLEVRMNSDDWNSSSVRFRNFYLSFQYNSRRGIYIS